MTNPQRIAELSARVMWDDDPASQALGMNLVSVGPGRAVVSMMIRGDMVNGHATAHGGFTFTLADSAFAFACNSYNLRTVAQTCSITFLQPVRLGETIVAEALERSRVGRNGIYDVTLRRDDQVVAEFRGQSREIGGTFF